FFFQAEDGIRDDLVTGVQTCALPICIGTSATGLNLFADPAAVYNSCSRPLLSVNKRIPFDELHALPQWNVDLSLGKDVRITEREIGRASCRERVWDAVGAGSVGREVE